MRRLVRRACEAVAASSITLIACMPVVLLVACAARVTAPAASTRDTTPAAPPVNVAATGAPAVAPALDPQMTAIVVRGCYPCHSDERRDPWYAKLAPSSWSTRGARETLNFSAWSHYDAERRAHAAAMTAAVVEAGTMPPADYTFFNHAAKLSDEDKRTLVRWAAPSNP